MTFLPSVSRMKEDHHTSRFLSLTPIMIFLNLLITINQTKELDNNKTSNSNLIDYSSYNREIRGMNATKIFQFGLNEKNSKNIYNEENFNIINNYSKLKNRILQPSNCRVSNCKTCPLRNSCTACNSGFYLSKSTCSACSNGCLQCTSQLNCTQCDSSKDYFLNQNKTCSICPKNCKTCNATGNCIVCQEGYYLPNKTSSINQTSSSICLACLSNCKTCISSSSCLECNDYYLLDSISNKCLSCYETNCNTCDLDGKCQSCNAGYFLNKEFICTKCGIDNCRNCNSDGKCASCENGYFLSNANSACKKCSDFDENCLTCSGDQLCNSCSGPAYLDFSITNYITTRTCKRCERGTYVKNSDSCGSCTDFGKCSECSTEGCSLCVPNSSPGDYSSCVCDYGYVSMGNACMSLLIVIVPIGFLGVLVIVGSYCYVRFKRINALSRRRVGPPNVNNNDGNNAEINNNNSNNQANRINNRNGDNNPPHNNNDNSNINHRHIRIALKNRILKPLVSQNQLHGNKCIFGDDSPPFWEFDCGGYMCNPCSLKFVTNFTPDKGNCPKCTKPFSYFKFVNRFLENEDSVKLNNQSVIKIDNIKSDSLNNSLNESQNDSSCKICFVLKTSKQIKCDSNTPHMLCSYCYNRLINIEEIEHCPFCRNDIHR